MSYQKDNEIYPLSAPLINIDGTIYIQYDDVAFAYEDENDFYREVKKETVLNAYSLMESQSIPGITLAFVDYEKNYIWMQGFGYADMENQEHVTSKTLFNIVSVSKTFTATAIMQLVEQGKIKLDDKVVDYIPEFVVKPHPVHGGNSNDITIEMILTHLSGLPGDIYDGFYTTENFDEKYMNHLVSNFANSYMANNQMTRSGYSNAAISLLGVIISRLSGNHTNVFEGFTNYTDKNLFQKMNMNHSSFNMKDSSRLYMAKSYTDSNSGQEDTLYVNSTPCGSVFSNAEDMSQYMGFILNGGTMNGQKILSSQCIDTMLTPVNWDIKMNPTLNIGMVWTTMTYHGIKMVGHGGDVQYFHADLQLIPEEKLGIFVSGNSATSIMAPNTIAANTLATAYSVKTGYVHKPVAPIVTEDTPISREAVEKYLGTYLSFGNITADDEGSIIFSDFNLIYKHQNDGTFYERNTDSRFRFETINDNDVIFEVYPNGNEVVVSEKLNLKKATEDFDQWLGEYVAVSEYPNNVPMIKGFKFQKDANGYAIASFNTIGNADGQYFDASPFYLDKVDDHTYYVMGTSRLLGYVFDRYEKNGKSYVIHAGTHYMKKGMRSINQKSEKQEILHIN